VKIIKAHPRQLSDTGNAWTRKTHSQLASPRVLLEILGGFGTARGAYPGLHASNLPENNII
jgi:hypothetical protein